jgi:hypothetical protein
MLSFEVLCWHLPKVTEKKHEIFSQNSRSPGPDLNQARYENDAGFLTTRLRRSMYLA